MPPKKPKKATPTRKPSHFFKKQLAGEQAPSLASMEDLLRLAGGFADLEPWKARSDADLVMVPALDNQLCFCSVMGALGEVFALQVYIGLEGYRFFQRVSSGLIRSSGDFFAGQRGVSVEFVQLKELTAPDRELLKALGHPLRRGTFAPLFRANRPGYHPWYITEAEANLLRCCLQAEIALLDALSKQPDLPLWDRENAFPAVRHIPVKGHPGRYEIRVEDVPPEPKSSPVLPVLDERKLNATLARQLPMNGVFEIDRFYGNAVIGGPNQRKACMRVALVVDANSGLVFPPLVESPSLPVGDMLVKALYTAIEAAGATPAAVQVVNPEFKVLLAPFAAALGFRVELADSLPALEPARQSLLSFIGGEGPL
ncbi:MAG: DUF7309 domain-containing protein [Bryobacteraceae bacterium]